MKNRDGLIWLKGKWMPDYVLYDTKKGKVVRRTTVLNRKGRSYSDFTAGMGRKTLSGFVAMYFAERNELVVQVGRKRFLLDGSGGTTVRFRKMCGCLLVRLELVGAAGQGVVLVDINRRDSPDPKTGYVSSRDFLAQIALLHHDEDARERFIRVTNPRGGPWDRMG